MSAVDETPDQIADRYARERVGLKIGLINDDEGLPLCLIEGGPVALRMLGEMLIAVSVGGPGSDFWMSPDNPGRVHFSKHSKYGIYINCTEQRKKSSR